MEPRPFHRLAMKRPPEFIAKHNSKAIHNVTSPLRIYVAVETEIPIPLTIAK